MTKPNLNFKNVDVYFHSNAPLKNGVAYVSAGALWLDESRENSVHNNRHRAFLHVGFHGRRPDMSDSADVQVVNDLPGGQLDLSFCTLDCLRSWVDGILDQLQSTLSK